MSTTWHAVCPADAFPEEGKLAASFGGWQVLVVREGAAFHAFNDRCPHQGARLSPGRVRRGAVMCPLHGARFGVTDGACIGGAYPPLRVFPVRVADGALQIALPDTPPGPGDLPV